jgi:hypothetical protein
MANHQIDLMAEVPRAVGQHWRDRNAPVLLSALGMRLHPDARAELRVLKENLSDYVSAHLIEQVRMLVIPGKGLAAVPAGETANLSEAELIKLFQAMPRGKPAQSNPRFYPQVWRAFSQPLTENGRRFLLLRPPEPPGIEDVPLDAPLPQNALEIRPEDLPEGPLGYGMPPGPVGEAIRTWTTAQQLDVASLYAPTPLRSHTEQPTPPREVESLLGILGMIEPSELSRISIPGDIVVNLIRRVLAKR